MNELLKKSKKRKTFVTKRKTKSMEEKYILRLRIIRKLINEKFEGWNRKVSNSNKYPYFSNQQGYIHSNRIHR